MELVTCLLQLNQIPYGWCTSGRIFLILHIVCTVLSIILIELKVVNLSSKAALSKYCSSVCTFKLLDQVKDFSEDQNTTT